MRKSLREVFRTLFLVLASVNLGISSDIVPLGILFALGFGFYSGLVSVVFGLAPKAEPWSGRF